MYVIPVKLAAGAEASWYLFGYAGDEYTYAYRIQPLPPGVSAANPVNAAVDPKVVSPFYLEDLCRAFLSVTGLHPIAFFWIWRFTFPLVLMAGIVWLVFVAMPPRRRRLWSWRLNLAAAAAAVPVLLAAYDLITRFPPLQGWLFRIPGNIEYPLSIAVGIAAVRFVRVPSPPRAFQLALALAALSYLRFYTAVPWLLAAAVMGVLLFASGLLSKRSASVFIAAFSVMMAPWLAVNLWNGSLDTFRQLMTRYFGSPDWMVSPFWPVYVCCVLVLIGIAWSLPSAERALIAACAVAIGAMCVLSGLLPFAKELHSFDRMGSFYFVACLLAAALWLGHRTRLWSGFAGARRGSNVACGLLALGMLCASALLALNLRIDFNSYPASPYPSVLKDMRCVEGYEWARLNTPQDALFIVDDGIDWSSFTTDAERDEAWKRHTLADDLFLVVAKRSRVHHIRMYGNAISDEQYRLLKTLHYGTVGMPVAMVIGPRDYVTAIQMFKPSYILWKKCAPYPRAMGHTLKPACGTVYSDEGCEIWKIDSAGFTPSSNASRASAGPE